MVRRSTSVKRVAASSASRANELPEYLIPDFDPAKLTKPQLRSILGECGITDSPPANAKKEVLVELFRNKITRNLGEIVREKKNVRPSDKGIAYLDDHSQPSPKKPSSSRSPRKSSPQRSASPLARKQSGKASVADNTGAVRERRGRRAGNAKAAPSQSPPRSLTSPASSPVKRHRTPSPSPQKSASWAKPNSPLAMLQNSLPKFADSPQEVTKKLHDRLDFIASANHLRSAKAAMSLSPARTHPRSPSAARKAALLKSAKAPISISKAPMKTSTKLFAFAILFSVLAGYIYIKNEEVIPFCDTNALPPRLKFEFHSNVFEGLYSSLKQYCLPCPLHGKCIDGKVQCEDGYVFTPNYVALGGSCRTDLKKLSLIDDLVGRVKAILSQRAGLVLCGEISVLDKIMTEAQIARELQSRWPKAEWNTGFDKLYLAALQQLGKNPENHAILISHSPLDNTILLQSTKPSLSLKCRLKLELLEFYTQNKMHIIISISSITLLVVFISYLKGRRQTSQKVDELVQAVIQILAEQDALNRRDPTTPSTISIHQIRDALFMKSSNRTRNRLWPLVCSRISRNSNVRESIMSIKGEQHRVWEWIGSDVLSPLHNLAPA